MKLIVGLGNPGRTYTGTRHNVAWWLLDHYADSRNYNGWSGDGESLATSRRVDGQVVRLLKPQTYMNLSGLALRPYLRRDTFMPAEDLLVVTDDVALPVGTLRLRAGGSAGGHNGLKSVQDAVGSMEYARMRIGIRPEDPNRANDLSDFVLSRFAAEEREVVEALLPTLMEALDCWLAEGIEPAMNRFNRKPQPPTE